jgi:N-acetylglucosaminyl-diphospho-decaprenol L-rhamnosyltransferase
MELAVVIVNYNTRDLLRNALRSLFNAQLPANGELTVLVVDNASHDESAAMVARDFPQVTLLASPTNLGFTGGNNLALYALGLRVSPPASASQLTTTPRPSPPNFVLLLNPDTEIADDALIVMLEQMERLPSAGICGAHLSYGDGSFQHGAFHFPSLTQVALDFFPLIGISGAQRLRDSRINGRYPAAKWQSQRPFAVDFVLGAAMFVRAAAINDIGGLDDGYFMYCEEMDWALRMQQAGWRVYALPTAHVTHHEGQSSRQLRWDSYERLWRSRFRFYTKHAQRYPLGYRLALRLLVRLGATWRSHQARQRFAIGSATGTEIARELEAYATISRY